MPSVKPPQPTHFEPVQPTAEKLEYADLPTLDFSELKNGDAGKAKLSETLNNVMRTQGFFYIVNHGLSEEEVTRQVDIGYTVLNETPLEEKMKLVSQMQEKGCYRGFKLRDYYQYDPSRMLLTQTSKWRCRQNRTIQLESRHGFSTAPKYSAALSPRDGRVHTICSQRHFVSTSPSICSISRIAV